MSPAAMPLMPSWIQTLPTDERGFPVPAEAPWSKGAPQFKSISMPWKLGLALHRACAVCGYAMAPGNPVYRVFAQGDAAQIRLNERELSHDTSGPGHRSCMVFSAMTCPYLTSPTARLNKQSLVQPGGRRGRLAAIMGFDDAYLLMPEQPGPDFEFAFAYARLIDDVPYTNGDQLGQLLSESIKDDTNHIDTGSPRHYWTSDDADSQLVSEIQRWFRKNRPMRARFATNYLGVRCGAIPMGA